MLLEQLLGTFCPSSFSNSLPFMSWPGRLHWSPHVGHSQGQQQLWGPLADQRLLQVQHSHRHSHQCSLQHHRLCLHRPQSRAHPPRPCLCPCLCSHLALRLRLQRLLRSCLCLHRGPRSVGPSAGCLWCPSTPPPLLIPSSSRHACAPVGLLAWRLGLLLSSRDQRRGLIRCWPVSACTLLLRLCFAGVLHAAQAVRQPGHSTASWRPSIDDA